MVQWSALKYPTHHCSVLREPRPLVLTQLAAGNLDATKYHSWTCRIVSQILRWVVDPMVLVSVAILLAFCLAVVLIQKHGKSKGLLAMRREFYRYRRDMQSKVDMARLYGP